MLDYRSLSMYLPKKITGFFELKNPASLEVRKINYLYTLKLHDFLGFQNVDFQGCMVWSSNLHPLKH